MASSAEFLVAVVGCLAGLAFLFAFFFWYKALKAPPPSPGNTFNSFIDAIGRVLLVVLGIVCILIGAGLGYVCYHDIRIHNERAAAEEKERKEKTVAEEKERKEKTVRTVIDQYCTLGNKFSKDIQTKPQKEVAPEFVRSLHNIDLLSCPEDFQAAFLKHVYAWDAILPIIRKYDGIGGMIGAAAERFYFGDSGINEAKQAVADIQTTRLEVERVGLRYNVRITHGN